MKEAIGFAVHYVYTNAIKVAIIPWILWFYLIWLEFFIVVIFWCFVFSCIDMLSWRFLAKQKWVFSSQERMRWWFKRGVYYSMAWMATLFSWNLAQLTDTPMSAIMIVIIPFLVWVWLSLREVDSILENREEYDKNNPVTRIARKIIKFLFRKAEKKVDDKLETRSYFVDFIDGIWKGIDVAYYNSFIIKKR